MTKNELSVSLMQGWAGCRSDPHLSYGLIRDSRGPLDSNVLAHGMSHDIALGFAELFQAAKAADSKRLTDAVAMIEKTIVKIAP